MATAPGTITDAAPKKKKRSIFGVLFHRKKSKKKDKKVRETHEIMNVILIWLCFFLSTVFFSLKHLLAALSITTCDYTIRVHFR